jgi:hypothetical protein
MHGVFVGTFASAILLLAMHLWVLILWIGILCGAQYIWCTFATISSSSGCCCCQVGCLMWSFIKNMLLRLSVNSCVCLFGWFVWLLWQLVWYLIMLKGCFGGR